jgi:hypothetical protein
MNQIKLTVGITALVALLATIIATPAMAQERTLNERVGTASPVRQAPVSAPRCSVRHTSFGAVKVCK